MKPLPTLLACLALAAWVRAEEPATPAATPADATPQPAAPPADAASAAPVHDLPENERFKPSEKISEDLSVSFPADI